MRSIRKFAYAAVLSLSIFAVQPTLAAAEDTSGTFTLSHEVHWQKCVLGPGDYTFSVKTVGLAQFLMLRELNGTRMEAILLVNNVETPKPGEVSKLVLVPRNGQIFVQTMDLPEQDMTLRFAVPPERASR
jgi:hypothetical protein